ncbi:HAD family hydrolase [Flavobacterium sp. TSSA_36]|uniref:HAD family hydrolase n=1 Tax=Flavobacterium sp. TSSA_36 TaxID=3447669 RepID=UPI003F3F67A9
MNKKKCIVFDLDDTLVYEVEFLKSAFIEISNFIAPLSSNLLFEKMIGWFLDGQNVFNELLNLHPELVKDDLLSIYRNHKPTLALNDGAYEILNYCIENYYYVGLITDGRTITQRNKLQALNIENYFTKIIISEEFGTEKPSINNFKVFHELGADEFFYIGDNPKKDFITPNKLGWTSVCLKDKGQNIHEQHFDLPSAYLPQLVISSLNELIEIIEYNKKL